MPSATVAKKIYLTFNAVLHYLVNLDVQNCHWTCIDNSVNG